jgi:predicted alpha/beta superfamily hydrolase
MLSKILFKRFAWLSLLLTTLGASQLVNALEVSDGEPLISGQKYTLKSKVLGEAREIIIGLPHDYDPSGDKRYPVYYALDGDGHFNHVVGTLEWLSRSSRIIPGHIVVAIPNTDRFRDFSTSMPKDLRPGQKANGADKFIEFMKTELIPYIDNKYLSNNIRTLSGHSFAGAFTLHAMLTQKNLFSAYIAVSPWVIFNDQELLNRYEQQLKTDSDINATLFVTIGNEPNLQPAYDRLIGILEKQAPKGLMWQSNRYELENHMSVASKTMHNAMIAIAQNIGWLMPEGLPEQGLVAIKKYYKKMSHHLGEQILPPENAINNLGYELVEKQKIAQGIAMLTYNTKNYPLSLNTYDSLADAHDANNDLVAAEKALKTAVTLAKMQQSDNLEYVQNHLKTIQGKMKQ